MAPNPVLSQVQNKQSQDGVRDPVASITMGCWNIRRGLVKRELEIINLINSKKAMVMFLVETDSQMINEEKDYRIENYRTVFQKKENPNDQTRMIGLLHESIQQTTTIREDLMEGSFPSIWIEVERENERNLLVCGFYREWTRKGVNSQGGQMEALKSFTTQIERAANEGKSLVLMGDANLCSEKWAEPDYVHQILAEEIKSTLALCGLKIAELGQTYLADRLSEQGNTIRSSLDHIYFSEDLGMQISTEALEESSTDHLPVIAHVKMRSKQKNKPKTITKRSLKNLTTKSWNDALIMKNWESLGKTEDPNEMALLFTELVNEALDECAPFKTFKIKPGYKPGLTETAKQLMKERDEARRQLKRSPGENKILHEKYKRLRNRTTQQIRRDAVKANGKRIEEANNESEVWKVVKEINTPRSESNWTLIDNNITITEEREIAETFNNYFVEKIANLKARIDPNRVKEPLNKLKNKVRGKNLNFSLKTVTERTVRKVMDRMKKKKSKGPDGISQELLLLGKDMLVIPLTRIINSSINEGKFPDCWKEATVTPILKKGATTDKTNYRPVSCLNTASKVLEKVICNQLTKFMEVNGLLPNNQHGFREGRSTMTALTEIQKKWITSTEEGQITGVLIWDLSAAFDTLDPNLLCQKLDIYGVDKKSREWFHTFLTKRTQRVKIGNQLSNPLFLTSGVPQGGILSPIIFTIYGADMEEWVDHSTIFNYADDTSSSCVSKSLDRIQEKLESDADKMLDFMASNGLVANPKKTVYMLLGRKKQERETSHTIRVGDSLITNSHHSKLLGVTIDDEQNWKEQFCGKGGLISTLNSRLFTIRRISKQIPFNQRKKLINSLWMSKLRYGLQLCSTVRCSEDESKSGNMRLAQVAQNKMLRLMDGVTVKNRTSIKDLLKKADLPSVNQLAATIKLTETWKSVNIQNYPTRLITTKEISSTREVRGGTRRQFEETARLKVSKMSFVYDAARLWNNAPQTIKECKTLASAKREIKKYCRTLPI